jgi:phosphate-selective porin OprO and OprP
LPNLDFSGGYAEAAWSLTGETHPYNPATAAYGSLIPDHPVLLFGGEGGGYGAWELAARYSYINLNDLFTPGIPTALSNGVAGGAQTVYTVGLNWYVNRNVRLTFNYLHGTEDKFSGTAATPTDIGAKFDALAMRTQVSF